MHRNQCHEVPCLCTKAVSTITNSHACAQNKNPMSRSPMPVHKKNVQCHQVPCLCTKNSGRRDVEITQGESLGEENTNTNHAHHANHAGCVGWGGVGSDRHCPKKNSTLRIITHTQLRTHDTHDTKRKRKSFPVRGGVGNTLNTPIPP